MKRYFSCEDNCGMFVALDKLFCDRRGAALPLSGQRFGGRGQTKITPLPAVPPPQLGHTSVHSELPHVLSEGVGQSCPVMCLVYSLTQRLVQKAGSIATINTCISLK